MSFARRAAVLALAVLASSASAALAGDCAGGTVHRLRIRPDRLVLQVSVTRPGVTATNFVDGAGLLLRIVDADDAGQVLHEVAVPAERFVTDGRKTKYDRQGDFQGRIVLRGSQAQADTVRITLKEFGSALDPGSDPRNLRVELGTGAACVRTCVAACQPRGASLACEPSAQYAPFTDEGFGTVVRARRQSSPLCGLAIDATQPCDFLIEERCVLPFPSSYFLAADPTTPTGLRVSYGAEALPANAGGTHIDPTDWNTLDGFSPAPMILALFPDTGFPVDMTDVAFHTDFARSLDADHPIVLLEAATGTRIVHFAELDANTSEVAKRALIVRPGTRLKDATRYIVAFRNLHDTQGTPIRPRLAFRALRDAVPAEAVAAACGQACAAAVETRRPAFDDLFATLAANGVEPAELVLAWDFSTASTQALTGWLVAVRDQAFALGTPAFTVTSVNDGGGLGFNTNVWARIQGTFQAPLFMSADAPASRLNLVGGVPQQNGFATVPFVVDVPRKAWNGSGVVTPGRPSLWGHGLLGDRFQVGALDRAGNEYGYIAAAVDMQGMSSADVVPAVIPLIQDLSKFHFIPERLQQGLLNHLLLGRLLVDPVNGFNSDPAFHFGPGSTPVIDTTEVFYSGGSQGGIFGGTIMAVAEDFRRGFLAVPGANYSTLLHRASPFKQFLDLLRPAYPDRLDEQLGVALIQQLWDRADPIGFLPHILPGDLSSPPVPHKILIHMNTNDCQVSNLGTEIMVRSLGIPQLTPVHRTFFGVPEMAAPFDGSALVETDYHRGFSRCDAPEGGSPGAMCTTDADCPGAGDPPTRTACHSGIPPLENLIPPFDNGAHGAEGSLPPTAPVQQQVEAFLRPNGTVQQFCTGACDPN